MTGRDGWDFESDFNEVFADPGGRSALRATNKTKDPPCEETPTFDDFDTCMWCGAEPTQACQWNK